MRRVLDPGAIAANRAEHDQIGPERHHQQEQMKQRQRPPRQKRGLFCRRHERLLHQPPLNVMSAGRELFRKLMLQIERVR